MGIAKDVITKVDEAKKIAFRKMTKKDVDTGFAGAEDFDNGDAPIIYEGDESLVVLHNAGVDIMIGSDNYHRSWNRDIDSASHAMKLFNFFKFSMSDLSNASKLKANGFKKV